MANSKWYHVLPWYTQKPMDQGRRRGWVVYKSGADRASRAFDGVGEGQKNDAILAGRELAENSNAPGLAVVRRDGRYSDIATWRNRDVSGGAFPPKSQQYKYYAKGDAVRRRD